MASLRTTITLDSSTLFPNPLSIKTTDTETIDGNSTSLVTNQLQPSANEILLETGEASGNSGIIYLYCQSASTNSNFGIDIYLTHKTNPDVTLLFARLLSGNAAVLPIYAADANGILVNIKNNDPVSPATVTYLYGSKD
jgi:hypothetical protein